MGTDLTKVDDLIAAIQATEDIFELQDYRDQASGVHKIAVRRGMRNVANKAKEAEIRAEIGAGEWLAENGRDAGRPNNSNGPLPLSELGISKMQSSRWQRTAKEYGEDSETWDAKIAEFVKTGAELTKAALMRAIWGAILGSKEMEWWTPKKYIDAVLEVMGAIDLDPASNAKANEIVGADRFYSTKNDGLAKQWQGKVFLNPPYGKIGPWFIEKLYESLGSGVDEAIVLVNSRATDADWFQPMFEGVLCFTDHRIDFDSPDNKETSSTHGSCFIYFGPNEQKFAEIFGRFGNIVKRWS